MKRRQFTRADKGQAALLEEIRGMRSELRKMCGFLRVWEINGLPAERVSLLPADAATAVEENFGKLDPAQPTPFEQGGSQVVCESNIALAERIRSIREQNVRSASVLSDWLERTAPVAKPDAPDGTDPSDSVESRRP